MHCRGRKSLTSADLTTAQIVLLAFPKRNVENIVAADVAVPIPTRFIDTCLDVHSIQKKVYYYEYRVSELI